MPQLCSTTFADRTFFKNKYTSSVLLSHPNAGGYYIVTQTMNAQVGKQQVLFTMQLYVQK